MRSRDWPGSSRRRCRAWRWAPGVAGHHRNATAANLAVHILNYVAGNVGRTVRLRERGSGVCIPAFRRDRVGHWRPCRGAGWSWFMEPIRPIPFLPHPGFPRLFDSAGFKVSFASTMDETAELCDLLLPDRHLSGVAGVIRIPGRACTPSSSRPCNRFPTSTPRRWGTFSSPCPSAWGRIWGPPPSSTHLRSRWQGMQRGCRLGPGASTSSGGRPFGRGSSTVPDRESEVPVPLRSPDAILNFDLPRFDGDGEFALVVYPSPRFGDGRHANRPWLQELPDPVSKMAWHSWVEVQPHGCGAPGCGGRGCGPGSLSPRRGRGAGLDLPGNQGRHGGAGHGRWPSELRPIRHGNGRERHGLSFRQRPSNPPGLWYTWPPG